jgi:hypothetical protein
MKLSVVAVSSFFLAASPSMTDAFSFTQPVHQLRVAPRIVPTTAASGPGSLMMISTGDDRSERRSLDISKTTYTSLVKAPKDAYMAVSDKKEGNHGFFFIIIFSIFSTIQVVSTCRRLTWFMHLSSVCLRR